MHDAHDDAQAAWENEGARAFEAHNGRFDDYELDTLLVIAKNRQSGRITEHEIKALVAAYRDHTNLLKSILHEPDGTALMHRIIKRVLDARETTS